ncbi:hypothetical protein SAMN04487851_11477 [Prevotella sp. tc2-28]|nr:hypothetical protein SAMN04487851_11477 [Prevotella sp. tc2-28]
MNKEERVDEQPTQLPDETNEEYAERLRFLNPYFY